MRDSFDIKKMLLIRAKIADFYNSCINQAAKRCGISKAEADVLLFFYNNPDFFLESDAVKFRGFDENFLRNSVDLLVSNGLVTVSEDSTNRKIVINGKGGIIAKSINGAQKRAISGLFKDFSADDFAHFERILSVIVKNAGGL